MLNAPRAALVVDALPAVGGAEKVLLAAMELFPDAPIYTLVYNRKAFAHTSIASRQVITSYLDRLPLAHTQYRKYLPLMPHAIEGFNLNQYDLLVSFSYAVAHGILTRPGQTHVSYTYTPMRYAWRKINLHGEQDGTSKVLNTLFQAFRRWDAASVLNIERFAAVSRWIAGWVEEVYHRQAKVIYPPVEVGRFTPQLERGREFVTVSRLVAHKRVDLIVEAFNRLKLPLIVIGDGPERAHLERRARSNIRFTGFLPDEAVSELLGRARGFISASVEDFGIAMVEAQAAGCPVIAIHQGGSVETIKDGETGLFFDEQTSEHLVEAVSRCVGQIACFDPRRIAASVRCYNPKRFLQEFAAFAGVPVVTG